MASVTPRQGSAKQPLFGNRARVLLVNKDPQDLAHYRQILQKLGCQVRTSSSFSPRECIALGASRLT
jgi:PleD family two-component response regulator